MMQVGLTLPSHNLHVFQARRASFKCRGGSTLNPSSNLKPPVNPASNLELKNHLFNLDKLLQKHSQASSDLKQDITDPVILQHKQGRGLLEGLNLARIWPEMKAAEEMSPRHLNRLQRLLSRSSSMEYSPRNILGNQWREYHGCNDWSGLLDPLDENLRREVIRYGEFVQAAYHGFHSNPAMSPNEPPSPRHVALPDRSYKVTRSLYATSSIGLPKWVDDVAPDLGWMTQRSSWIGYVAVCDDMAEIHRMGRRDIVIALRGTATCLEWAENFRDFLVPISSESENIDTTSSHGHRQAKVECGFSSLYKTQGAHVPSLSQAVVHEVQRLVELYKGETLSITVTGHSLGAALALLVADEVSRCSPNAPPVAVFSFGSPRVGNRDFANRINNNNVKVLRIVNNQDVITRVPGMFVSEELDRKLRSWKAEKLLNVLDNMPWAYSHVGTELRVDTKMSPFLKPNADVACCHDLEAYLHLVDGFLASNCPFRANAKRSLCRLLNEQKSNIKMLYTNKEKGLTLKLDNENWSTSTTGTHVLPSPS